MILFLSEKKVGFFLRRVGHGERETTEAWDEQGYKKEAWAGTS